MATRKTAPPVADNSRDAKLAFFATEFIKRKSAANIASYNAKVAKGVTPSFKPDNGVGMYDGLNDALSQMFNLEVTIRETKTKNEYAKCLYSEKDAAKAAVKAKGVTVDLTAYNTGATIELAKLAARGVIDQTRTRTYLAGQAPASSGPSDKLGKEMAELMAKQFGA